MKRMDVHRNRGAVATALLFLVAALLLLAASGAEAGKSHGGKGGKGKSLKPKLTIKGADQGSLLNGDKVVVQAKSKKTVRARIGIDLVQDGKTTKATPTGGLKVRKGKKAKINLAIDASLKPQLQSCLSTQLVATATFKAKGKKGKVTKKTTVKQDPTRCNGVNPVGVDVADADHCDLIAPTGQECLFPYPNDFYTSSDSTTGTGKRLDLKTAAMPKNAGGTPIDPTDINQSDGFSPGAPILVRVPGMDTPAAFAATNPVPLTNMDAYADASAPVVLIDADTGARQLIWTELDSNASTPGQTVLEIHPGKNLQDGHHYIVALRNMKDASGSTLSAPEGFRLLRDGIPSGVPAIESRRAQMEKVFSDLGKAGIGRSDLYLAWDFTVASTENITGRMVAMRNKAFADLGDTNLTDGTVQGTSPNFTVTNVTDYPITPVPVSGRGVEDIRTVEGTFQVPCFMTDPDGAGPKQPCDPGSKLNLNANGVPQENGTYTARFGCDIPRSAVMDSGGNPVVATPARPATYGHGLFGEYTEVFSQNIRQLGTENGVLNCATDFIGMADEDQIPVALPALQDLSKFGPLPDRLQQGFLDFLYLDRLLIHPNGFASDPAFKFAGTSVINTSNVFYWGNSQGGIAGGALTAIGTDVTRSVLYVPGMSYSTLLPRSVDFDDPDPNELDFASILYPSYPTESDRPLALSLIQSLWDRGEPDGYANHMTTDPLPGTPAHKVLIVMAYGDHQVANVTTEVEARTIGAPLRNPTVDPSRIPAAYGTSAKLFPQQQTLGDLAGAAADGSGYFVWDIGNKRDNGMGGVLGTDPPPITNTPPPGDAAGVDPHDTVVRASPLVRAQIANFIKANGKITNPCGTDPCYAAGYHGFP